MQSSGGRHAARSRCSRRAVSLLGSGPTGGRHGGGPGRRPQRRARLRGGRHGRHLLRRLPGAAGPARRRHRLELAPPLLRQPPHGRHPQRGGGRGLHRPGAPGGPARRPRVRRLGARAGLLRPRRRCRPPSPTATPCSATCRPRASPAAAWSSTSRPAAPPSPATSPSRSGLDVDDAAWAIQRIVNANMANAVRKVLSQHGADPRTLSLDGLRRRRAGARLGPGPRARHPTACWSPRPHRPSPRSGCWSRTTWST